jgi:hypothetical protein
MPIRPPVNAAIADFQWILCNKYEQSAIAVKYLTKNGQILKVLKPIVLVVI